MLFQVQYEHCNQTFMAELNSLASAFVLTALKLQCNLKKPWLTLIRHVQKIRPIQWDCPFGDREQSLEIIHDWKVRKI